MKAIALYLPQYHSIPENDKWWGEGFTEWVTVKAGKPLVEGQNQPRIPLNDNYYCLLDEETQKWQIQIAKENNIYGFCYYHYWFEGHLLLQKPLENMLANKELDMPFCICWANSDWTNVWVSEKENILMKQTYGDEADWKRHYEYLRQYFLDERYIRDNDRPLLVIYRPEIISCLNDMLDYWQKLAKEDGFEGLCFVYQGMGLDYPEKKDDSRFTYNIEYQPNYSIFQMTNINNPRRYSNDLFRKIARKLGVRASDFRGPTIRDYDEVWENIINAKPVSEKSVPCAFVDFDNTPRRKRRGTMFKGVSVQKFEKYFAQYVQKAKIEFHSEYMFIFAWNEWSEGGYLEPDEKNGYGFLNAICRVLREEG